MALFSEYRLVNALIKQKLKIVFYAESRHYYQYYSSLIQGVLAAKDITITYITSDKNDPLLMNAPAGIKVYYVKTMLGFLFSHLQANIVFMTMPDLGNFLYKRSRSVDRYVYIFHAAVSTHQQYNFAAFFNYDVIFCTGPYQENEIRKAEQLYNQKGKEIIPYGYPLIDILQRETNQQSTQSNTIKNILLAPSWFEGCIFDTCFPELILELAKLPCKVVVRSHPEYEKRKNKEFERIKESIKRFQNITIDSTSEVLDRLSSTDLLITDRSGIAFEFAFGTYRPVLFIETRLKEINKRWRELDLQPIENSYRSRLGISIDPKQFDQLPNKIKEIELMMLAGFREQLLIEKPKLFFNSLTSYQQGVNYILEKLRL